MGHASQGRIRKLHTGQTTALLDQRRAHGSVLLRRRTGDQAGGDGGGTRSVHAVTAVTLADEGTYSSYDIIAASVDISAQRSDTDMVLFVQSKNNKNYNFCYFYC